MDVFEREESDLHELYETGKISAAQLRRELHELRQAYYEHTRSEEDRVSYDDRWGVGRRPHA